MPGPALSSSRTPPTRACASGSAAPRLPPPMSGASPSAEELRAEARRCVTRSSRKQSARCPASDADAHASISVPVRSSRALAPFSVVARPSSGSRVRSMSDTPRSARSASTSKAVTSCSSRACRASCRGAVSGSFIRNERCEMSWTSCSSAAITVSLAPPLAVRSARGVRPGTCAAICMNVVRFK